MKIIDRGNIGKLGRGSLVRFIPYIIVGLILTLLPPFIPMYLQSMMTKILIFALFATSLDLIWGYTGLSSLGHAAFFGVGGYTTAILIAHYGYDSLWQTAPLSILMATLFAALFGLIALRVSGLYFLMVTLALGQLLFSLAEQMYEISGGQFGLRVPYPNLGITGFSFNVFSLYYFVLVIFLVCYFLLNRIVNSPFGLSLQGIREDEDRMRALGYNTWRYKYVAFIIAGFFAGISGILFAHWNLLMTPTQLGITTSTYGVLAIILGGAGTPFGPVIGAAVMVGLEYGISLAIPERWPLILGIIFVVAVVFIRTGIYPRVAQLWKKATGKYSYGSITH